jgi:CRISPR-associated protein Cas2
VRLLSFSPLPGRNVAKLWLVCYDVADDKRRTKLAKLIEQSCQRVQYSVFECPLEDSALAYHLQKRWLPILKLSEDNLRLYPLRVNL